MSEDRRGALIPGSADRDAREKRPEEAVATFKVDIVTMEDLFIHMLRDAHCVEDKIRRTQPEIIDRVCNQSLHEILSYHLAQTHDHLARIERAFERLGWLGGAASAECSPVDGLLERVRSLAAEVQAAAVRDAAIIAAAQEVKHHEISRYGTLVAWARGLGKEADVVEMLSATLAEERAADEALTYLAHVRINIDATA
jgi:ferritin-like metal-binding protein YciE